MYEDLDFSKFTCLNYPEKCNDCKYHYTGTFEEENVCIFELFYIHLGLSEFEVFNDKQKE